MDWLKFIDAVLICTTVLLIVGIVFATVVVCLISEKALDASENFAKVLATIREHARWLQPRPRE